LTLLEESLGKREERVGGRNMPQEEVGNEQEEEVEDDAHMSGAREWQAQHHVLMLPVDTDWIAIH
jgi:hypothetical protein